MVIATVTRGLAGHRGLVIATDTRGLAGHRGQVIATATRGLTGEPWSGDRDHHSRSHRRTMVW